MKIWRLYYLILICLISAFTHLANANDSINADDSGTTEPTIAQAKTFLMDAENHLSELRAEWGHAFWLASTYINVDSQFIYARAEQRYNDAGVKYGIQAARFDTVNLGAIDRRKMDLLKIALTVPPPGDPAKSRELSDIKAELLAIYGAGEYCRSTTSGERECLSGDRMEELMRTSRDPDELRVIWVGWRTVSPPMRAKYQRMIELGNEGSREIGYHDLSTLWRSQYDMDADTFAADIEKQWLKIKPFYDALHCHVRARLNEYYGDEVVPDNGPIPAHILGDQWAQEWTEVYDLVAPEGEKSRYDLNALVEANLPERDFEKDMVRIGERFFTSLGFEPLPITFWERSMLKAPVDHKSICHPMVQNIDNSRDVRLNMCMKRTAYDFTVIHHELGHSYYSLAYQHQPYLFQDGANSGFHEAIGDTIFLSITPKYLKQINWLENEPDASADVEFLLKQALSKIAFLPFGLTVEKWRWRVFNGEIVPTNYNKAWWDLREEYQGVKPPVERLESDFDPGAKLHIAENTMYIPYFLSFIQQFQFHRSLCEVAGHSGPLHRCSIYGNKAAGQKLRDMMAMGRSRPWQDAMETITGSRELDASAIIEYFAPLKLWLDRQNKGRVCGW
jgi:peptidyl-dipeptidase A